MSSKLPERSSDESVWLLGIDSLVRSPRDPNAAKSNDAVPDSNVQTRMTAAVIFSTVMVLYLAAGVLFFTNTQSWDVLDCIYFSVLTLTTIGYGDLTPESDGQKVFTIFYVLVGFCILGYALGHIGQYVAKREERLLMRQLKDARDGRDDMVSDHYALLKRVALAAHGMLFFLAIGTLFFSLNENWSCLDALYFCAVSLTTVGYGDLRLSFKSSRIFACVYLLLGTLMTAFFLGSIAELFMARNNRMRTLNLLYDEATNKDLWRTKIGMGSDTVSEADYMEYMLVASGRVDRHTVQEIKYRYHQLQKSGAVARLGSQKSMFTQSSE